MLTRRLNIIRQCLEYEKDLPEWERMPDLLDMEREDLEMYLDYLRSDNFHTLNTGE